MRLSLVWTVDYHGCWQAPAFGPAFGPTFGPDTWLLVEDLDMGEVQ